MTEAERRARFERSERAYWAGEWCGECAFEHEEDSRCCYPLPEQPVHWVGDAPTSLHGNGAASFERTARARAEVTCSLCLTLLDREPNDPSSRRVEPSE